jgi:hypothetical protein
MGANPRIADLESTAYDNQSPAGEFEIATPTFARGDTDPSTLFSEAIVWWQLRMKDNWLNEPTPT